MGRDAYTSLENKRNMVKESYQGQVKIASRCSGYRGNLPFLVMHKLTTDNPNFELASTALPILSHLVLANPEYYVSRDVNHELSAAATFAI